MTQKLKKGIRHLKETLLERLNTLMDQGAEHDPEAEMIGRTLRKRHLTPKFATRKRVHKRR